MASPNEPTRGKQREEEKFFLLLPFAAQENPPNTTGIHSCKALRTTA